VSTIRSISAQRMPSDSEAACDVDLICIKKQPSRQRHLVVGFVADIADDEQAGRGGADINALLDKCAIENKQDARDSRRFERDVCIMSCPVQYAGSAKITARKEGRDRARTRVADA